MHYILDGHVTVKCDNLMTWGKWFQTADRRVAFSALPDGVEVSTVFLGLNHRYDDGPPLLFETMVLGGPHDGDMDRYETWEQAEAGHAKIVAEVSG